eukprot:417682-Amorphochlora_amoeboformis.AAC.1
MDLSSAIGGEINYRKIPDVALQQNSPFYEVRTLKAVPPLSSSIDAEIGGNKAKVTDENPGFPYCPRDSY